MTDVIGWIGLGSIGHRMVRHLAAAGHTLVVADKASTEKAPAGATIARSNAEVAAKADIVILSLPDGKISEAVAREIASAPERRVKTVIDTSTIGIASAQAEAATLSKAGIEFIDSPVSGGIGGADKATLAVMMACSADAYARLKPLMANIGKPFHVGPTAGQAQTVKLLNNYLSASAQAATAEAVAFGVKQGIAIETVLEVVNASSGRNTATDDKYPKRVVTGSFDAGFTNILQAKDMRLYLENARASGIADEVASAVYKVWSSMEASLPGADITRMYPWTREGRVQK